MSNRTEPDFFIELLFFFVENQQKNTPFKPYFYLFQIQYHLKGVRSHSFITTLHKHPHINPEAVYINPANTDAAITVKSPATAIARLLIAPSTSPSSMAFAVPMAWAEVPRARPFAMGS